MYYSLLLPFASVEQVLAGSKTVAACKIGTAFKTASKIVDTLRPFHFEPGMCTPQRLSNLHSFCCIVLVFVYRPSSRYFSLQSIFS